MVFGLERTYKDKKQPLLSKRGHYTALCGLICFVICLVYSSSLIFGKTGSNILVRNTKNAYVNDDDNGFYSGTTDSYKVPKGNAVLKTLGINTGAHYFSAAKERRMRNRLKELEDQVAVYTHLLQDTKESKEEEHKVLTKKAEQAQKEAADAKRLLHELSTQEALHSDSQAKERDSSVLPPLKIYVYEMPEFYNKEQSRINPDCRYDYSTTWQTKYTLEVYLHEQLLKSKLRTTDPEEANLFYVPLYISCFMHARATNFFSANDMVQKSLHWVQQTHPYWNRTLGRDHVWTFTHDIGACVAPFRTMRHSIFITNTGELHDRSRAMAYYTGMYSPNYQQEKRDMSLPCYTPWKDIVAPPMINDQSLIDSKGGSKEGHHKRNVLASFRGTILTGGTWSMYSRFIRQKWKTLYEGDDEIHITAVHPREGMGSREKATKYAKTYRDDFLNSKFCLCPPGWATWTPRLYEALLLGCVPVVVADDNALPYSRTLDYSKFSVHIAEKHATKLRTILKQAEKRIDELRQGMKDVWQNFVYNVPPKPGDAFYNLMWELHFRSKTLGVMQGYVLQDPWIGTMEKNLKDGEDEDESDYVD